MTVLIIIVWAAILTGVITSIILSARNRKKEDGWITPHQEYETMKNARQESLSPIEETSHEGHSPYGKYGQNHEDRIGRTLIRHPEPEPGYVVLNGVKRKIEDCRNL